MQSRVCRGIAPLTRDDVEHEHRQEKTRARKRQTLCKGTDGRSDDASEKERDERDPQTNCASGLCQGGDCRLELGTRVRDHVPVGAQLVLEREQARAVRLMSFAQRFELFLGRARG